MNRSYWESELLPDRFDVVVIGSGIVGLSTAIYLKQQRPEWQVAVLERGLIPGGASIKNAGFACFGSLSEIVEDISEMGEDTVLSLIRQRWEGLNELLQLTRGHDIGYQNNGGFELFTEAQRDLWKQCASQLDPVNTALRSHFGQKVFTEEPERIDRFGFHGVEHLLYNPFEGQIHTGKMLKSLLQIAQKSGVQLLFGAEVNNWSESASGIRLSLKNHSDISCEKLVVATNGFARELLPRIEVRPTRAQVLITEPIAGLKVSGTFHIDRGYYYFRNIDQRILLGGARQMDPDNEYTADPSTTPIIQKELERILNEVILPGKNIAIENRWTGTMGTGPAKSPIVERITDRVVVAVRLSGMGIAIGSRIGRQAASLILD